LTGQTTEAIAELKKALELSPNSDEAYGGWELPTKT